MSPIIPDVPGAFLLGNLREMQRDRVGLLLRVPQFGDIARLRLGAFKVLVLSAPALVQSMLVDHPDAFVKSRGLSMFAKPLLGEGLVTSERDVHKRQRRIIAPAFMHKRIASYAETISALTERRIGLLRGRDEVDLSEELMQLTFEIVGKTLFGADLSGDASDVGDALTVAMETITEQLFSAVPLPPAVPTPRNLRGRRSVRRLDEVVYRMIRERRASRSDAGDLMSILLLAQDETDGSGMTDTQVRDEVMTAMLAGHETTANALAWSFALLAKNPSQRVRLEAELDAVLGGRAPTLADLPQLPFTLCVFKEAMRLYPPVYLVSRLAVRDVALGPYQVPKGSIVAVDIIGMHHRAEYFAEPETFDPDRFRPDREKQLVRGAYMPFSAGPRVCIGNHFALMEGQLALAHLAQHYRFELHSRATLEPEALLTLRPKGGLPVHVRPRRARPVSALHEAS